MCRLIPRIRSSCNSCCLGYTGHSKRDWSTLLAPLSRKSREKEPQGGAGNPLSFSKAREASVSALKTGCSNKGLGQLSKRAKATHSPEKGGAAQGASRQRSGNHSSLTTLFPAPPSLAQQLPWLLHSPAVLRLGGDLGGSFPGSGAQLNNACRAGSQRAPSDKAGNGKPLCP